MYLQSEIEIIPSLPCVSDDAYLVIYVSLQSEPLHTFAMLNRNCIKALNHARPRTSQYCL